MMPQIAMTEPGQPNRVRRFGYGRARAAQAFGGLPPSALLLLALLAVQLGSALATVLFSTLGPAGTAFASTIVSAAVLTALARPRLDRRVRQHAVVILLFGLADACMALPFFSFWRCNTFRSAWRQPLPSPARSRLWHPRHVGAGDRRAGGCRLPRPSHRRPHVGCGRLCDDRRPGNHAVREA